jgi:hypothetical protein
MNRHIRHHHACADCGVKTPCTGDQFCNYDGSPEIICEDFHNPGGTTNPDFICEACEWKRESLALDTAMRHA